MVRAVSKKLGRPRARHMKGINRVEQSQRIQEIILAMPEEAQRDHEKVKAKLADKGIELSDNTVYAHIKRARRVSGGNGEGLDQLGRVEIVSKAVKSCGGIEGVRETLKLIEKIKSL